MDILIFILGRMIKLDRGSILEAGAEFKPKKE
jgi:hypothetical protein